MVVVSNALLILTPLTFRYALSALETEPPSAVYYWAALLLSIATLSAWFKYWMRMSFIGISRDIEQEVRSKLFIRIQSQTRAFFDRHGIGELLSRLTNDISAYRDMLGPGMLYPSYFLTLVVPGVAVLFYISPPMASISLIPLMAIPLLNLFVRNTLFTTSLEVQQALGRMSDVAHEYYSGIRIVKGYEIEKAALARFQESSLRYSQQNFLFSCVQGLFSPFLSLMTKGVTIALVLVAATMILQGWRSLSAADFIAFMWIQSYLFVPILMLGWVLPIYQRGRAAYARLVSIYEEPIEMTGGETTLLRIPPQADIVLKDLTFSYPNQHKPALINVNLTIPGGAFVGITGPVGAGKTTLFRILCREYGIDKGKVFIGGHDINDYDLEAFFQEMVTVEQVPFLFSKTIAENVLFGKDEATRDELDAVVKQADLYEAILAFPEQYETVVGERGLSLSGGQKQRVAMARAFLVNRSILLLDDIFSAVDVETEKRIFSMMRQNLKGKTVLLITHRVPILEAMDRIVYMAEGKVKEEGSPKELLQHKGAYAALVELQEGSPQSRKER